jgi:hypothetical protein
METETDIFNESVMLHLDAIYTSMQNEVSLSHPIQTTRSVVFPTVSPSPSPKDLPRKFHNNFTVPVHMDDICRKAQCPREFSTASPPISTSTTTNCMPFLADAEMGVENRKRTAGEDLPDKRLKHNANERKRMQKMNMYIDELKQIMINDGSKIGEALQKNKRDKKMMVEH